MRQQQLTDTRCLERRINRKHANVGNPVSYLNLYAADQASLIVSYQYSTGLDSRGYLPLIYSISADQG